MKSSFLRSATRTVSKHSRGFSLTEVTIALGIFGGSILVLLGLTGITAEYSMTNREMTTACQLANRVFSDLSLPQQDVLTDDKNRVLNAVSGSTLYGSTIKPAAEHYSSTPLVWAFDESLAALPMASSEELYNQGSEDINGRFVVGVTFADEQRYQVGLGTAPPAGQPVLKRVLVSVEAPGTSPKDKRRKYEFYRIMQFQ